MVKIKRVYDPPEKDDGFRVLVDRLWPRGLSKATARIDLWMKEIAPSTALRKWFDHDPAKWKTFQAKYLEELKHNDHLLKELRSLKKQKGPITLLFGAKNSRQNQAVVLHDII